MKISVRGLTGEDYLSAIEIRDRAYYLEAKTLALQKVVGEGNPIKCAMCPVDDPDMLTFDHVDNSGADDRRKHGVGKGWLSKVVDGRVDASKLQILCANHNFKRMVESHRQREFRRSGKAFTLDQIQSTLNLTLLQAASRLSTSKATIRKYRALYGLDSRPQHVVE